MGNVTPLYPFVLLENNRQFCFYLHINRHLCDIVVLQLPNIVISQYIHATANEITSAFFMAGNIHLCIHSTYSLFILLLLGTKDGSITLLLNSVTITIHVQLSLSVFQVNI